ncbi:MAG: hypothetical protein HXX08_11425 [Chloroflexi bacterium]|uniref:Uncharacterized protein n=1 Tax=Candidatus Chlorohelix allophototropha TaxID=3003348 RepID=A0A8T7M2H7_9CHLR|nr:hypothetical protein [Chloroflexota bacterium]WJW65848.1 hypothetical protein OZ401_001627 [Chloroflexota bacterium L227-S17]
MLDLEFWRPEPSFLVPTGGSTLIPLNASWGGNNITFSVLDDQTFDLGSQPPDLLQAGGSGRYGQDIYAYTRKDRQIQFTLFAQAVAGGGNTAAQNLKLGVWALQSTLVEATQYNASSAIHNTGQVLGQPLFLKYQPDNTNAVYFWVKSGAVDLSQFDSQIRLLQNTAYVPITLITSYAAYGDVSWLYNLVPNGAFSNGTDNTAFNWTVVAGSSTEFNIVLATDRQSYYANGSTAGGTLYMSAEQAWGYSTDSPFSLQWTSPTLAAGYTSIVSQTVFLNAYSTGDLYWLSFEYKDNQFNSGFMRVYLEYSNNGTTGWTSTGTTISLGNSPNWTKFSWNSAVVQSTLTLGNAYLRVRIEGNKNIVAGSTGQIRKVALWHFPATLPSSFVKLPVEYVAQSTTQRSPAVLVNLQGNLETNAMLFVANPVTNVGDTNSFAHLGAVYQQLTLGARKVQGASISLYSNPNATVTIASNATSSPALSTLLNGFFDFEPRQYRVLLQITTDSTCGILFGSLSYSSFTGQNLTTIVPNPSLVEIPNTSSTSTFVDCGTVTIPQQRLSISINSTSANSYIAPYINFTRLASSSPLATVINITLTSIYFIPADQQFWADIRFQGLTISGTNGVSGWAASPTYQTGHRNLVINSLFLEHSNLWLDSTDNKGTNSTILNPAYTLNPIRLYPSTVTNPAPMMIGGAIRQADISGAQGLPQNSLVDNNPVLYGVAYCPAYEF